MVIGTSVWFTKCFASAQEEERSNNCQVVEDIIVRWWVGAQLHSVEITKAAAPNVKKKRELAHCLSRGSARAFCIKLNTAHNQTARRRSGWRSENCRLRVAPGENRSLMNAVMNKHATCTGSFPTHPHKTHSSICQRLLFLLRLLLLVSLIVGTSLFKFTEQLWLLHCIARRAVLYWTWQWVKEFRDQPTATLCGAHVTFQSGWWVVAPSATGSASTQEVAFTFLLS